MYFYKSKSNLFVPTFIISVCLRTVFVSKSPLKLNSNTRVYWHETEILLLPEKALYLPHSNALLIADPHFGKAAHFRKAGLPISEKVHLGDFLTIQKMIANYRPEQVLFLGDLFHSDLNNSWNDLEDFLSYLPEVKFHLIKGNHDILPKAIYRSDLWNVHQEPLQMNNLILSHEPLREVPTDHLNICGHIHPGISLVGKGRQRLKLPCFHISKQTLIMPAFGRFTGLALMQCEKNDACYAIAGKKVIPIDFM